MEKNGLNLNSSNFKQGYHSNNGVLITSPQKLLRPENPSLETKPMVTTDNNFQSVVVVDMMNLTRDKRYEN